MTATLPDLADVGRAFLELTAEQRAAFLDGLDERDLQELEAAVTAAELAGADWHETPATFAHHLTRGEYQLYPYIKLMAGTIADACSGGHPNRMIWIPSQMGKGLAKDTPIPTPTGWTEMGRLRVGDAVLDGDGRPTTVTYVSPDRHLDCYEVKTFDGATLVADGEHRWRVWDVYGHDPSAWAATGQKGAWAVVDTRALAADPRRYRLPATPDVDLPDVDLPLDPYALGVWLGDGHTGSARLTCSDPDLLACLADVGEPARKLDHPGDPYAYTWAGTKTGPRAGKFATRLRALGVLHDKHIPDLYARAGFKQRLALLQGLMDTDGSAYRLRTGYTQCEYTSTVERLAVDVLSLARSLGVDAHLRTDRARLNGRDCGPRYRVRFTAYLPVFRLPRKLGRLAGQPDGQRPRARVGVRSVTPVETVPTVCISVASPAETFLAGRYLTVTHNTTLLANWTPIWLLDRNPKLRIMYVSYDADKAVEEAGKARDLVEEHRANLRFKLRSDRKARGRWLTPQGGGVYAVGINGGITGWPVDVMLLDDLYKGWVAAHSPTIRNTVSTIYATQIRMRLQGGHCPKIYATTRWHENDLPDSLLSKSIASKVVDEWKVLRLAARAEPPDPKAKFEVYRQPDPLGRAPGEVIEPRRFDEAEVAARSAGMSGYLAAALEQQKPTPEEGDEIKRAWFKLRDFHPERYDLEIASWDMKLKDKETGDYVVGGHMGKVGSAIWLDDVLRGQWNQATSENAIALMQVRHPKIRLTYVENTGNGPEVMAALRRPHPDYVVSAAIAGELGMTDEERRAVQELRRAGMNRILPVNVKGTKSVRMRAVSGTIEGGDFYVYEASWTDAYLDEMAAFGPNAAHDDQVDMTSQGLSKLLQGQATAKAATGSTPKVSPNTRGGGTMGVTSLPAGAPMPRTAARVRSASRVVVPRGVPRSGR